MPHLIADCRLLLVADSKQQAEIQRSEFLACCLLSAVYSLLFAVFLRSVENAA